MPGVEIDIIGDIHGNLRPLTQLLASLGYDEREQWRHPDRRRLLFVGDLIDRGPASFEVAELVRSLCESGENLCLLGNHELNLVDWHRGRTGSKHSNLQTIAAIEADPGRWAAILDFFETLPLAVELPDLRVTHAVWHQGCFDQLLPALQRPVAGHTLSSFWRDAIRLHAPFEGGKMRHGLPTVRFPGQWENALQVFLKGYESKAPVDFVDNDGVTRDKVRTEWWKPEYGEVPRDRRTIFGHYWNMPPIESRHESFVPPHPSGHPDLRRWAGEHHAHVASAGTRSVGANEVAICIDHNGVTKEGARACVGAYRYPEAEVVWRAADLKM